MRLAREAERVKKERAAQDAKRQEEIRLTQEADRLKQERAAQEAKRQEEIRLAQDADRLKQREAQQAAARFFSAIRGTWTRAEEEKTEQSRTRTEEVLAIDLGGSGVLTRTVTKYEKGYTGWKSVGSEVSRFSIRCDAAGHVSGDLSGRISLQGATLLLGASPFARR
jgi:hypothetical protein